MVVSSVEAISTPLGKVNEPKSRGGLRIVFFIASSTSKGVLAYRTPFDPKNKQAKAPKA
jgi:hypothetical protein